jgi:NAD(P)-dependent dehydrogenase (short-subunit alcohol dehydrogenase family)
MTTLPQTPSFRLDGRRALVTGGSKGLGLAAAAALVQAGAGVTLVARNTTELIAAQAILTLDRGINYPKIPAGNQIQDHAEVRHASLDVTDSKAVSHWMAQDIAAHGPFDILVNNAGMNRPSTLVEMQDADLDAVIDLNIKAAFYVAREMARGLLAANNGKGKPGSIINMSSQMGHVGGPRRTLYCATKHAIEGMTKALAWELGRHQIRVNTLCPTYIETPMTAPMLADPAFREFAENGTALGRVGRIEEVMGAVVFLASDASTLVTGSALMLDGGWTAR